MRAVREKKGRIPDGKAKDVDYGRIQELVSQIKKLKGSYCREKDLYEMKAQEIWRKVHRFESELEYEGKLNGLYEAEINGLRELEVEFETMRQSILQKIGL